MSFSIEESFLNHTGHVYPSDNNITNNSVTSSIPNARGPRERGRERERERDKGQQRRLKGDLVSEEGIISLPKTEGESEEEEVVEEEANNNQKDKIQLSKKDDLRSAIGKPTRGYCAILDESHDDGSKSQSQSQGQNQSKSKSKDKSKINEATTTTNTTTTTLLPLKARL